MARLQPLRPPSAWQPAFDNWITHLKAAQLSSETVRTRRYPLVRFAIDSGIEPGSVTQPDLERWLASRELSRETAYEYRAGIRSFFAWYSETTGSPDPAAKLPRIVRPKRKPNPCPDNEIKSAIFGADPRLELMIRLAAEHGLRRGEIARVRGRDLELSATGLVLRILGKGGKERFSPIAHNEYLLIAALESAGDGYLFPGQIDGHLSAGHVGRLISRALATGWSAHKLRSRFATTAYAGSKDILELMTLLGHSSPETTLRYVSLVSEAGREMTAAARLDK